MKSLFLLIIVACTFSFGQAINYDIQPNIIHLNGFEDSNGKTHLFYRENSKYYEYGWYYEGNYVYHMNVFNGTDTLFLNDYGQGSIIIPGDSYVLTSYDFWNNDPNKLIFTGGSGAIDYVYAINTYFAQNMFDGYMFPITYVTAYKNSDTTFSFVWQSANVQSLLIKYKGHYQDQYFYDTLGIFKAISHSPYDNNIYFGENINGSLIKSVDEGSTSYLADNTIGFSTWYNDRITKTIFYDYNQNYIYRLALNYQGNKLMVSNNKGEPGSWNMKFTSPGKIFISNDASVAGLLYLSDGQRVYKSTDYGNSFTLYNTFNSKVSGLYKKPNSNKLYVSTAYHIYEVTPSSITIIKTLLEPVQLSFDPIAVGNKWVYKGARLFTDTLVYNYIKVKEVIKDTTISGKVFKKIMYTEKRTGFIPNISYQYQRIDPATGLVYLIDGLGNEYLADDLNILVGDTLGFSRFASANRFTLFTSVDTFKVFNTNNLKRNYLEAGLGIIASNYSLAEGLGLVYLRQVMEDDSSVDSLKGCFINGVVYGDTNSILAVNDMPENVPDKYTLEQNYPNPFNPVTTIRYSIPHTGKVVLKVFDVLGREVSQLVNEEKPAGIYEILFNASSISSGVYFYKLESGSYIETKKLILMK